MLTAHKQGTAQLSPDLYAQISQAVQVGMGGANGAHNARRNGVFRQRYFVPSKYQWQVLNINAKRCYLYIVNVTGLPGAPALADAFVGFDTIAQSFAQGLYLPGGGGYKEWQEFAPTNSINITGGACVVIDADQL